MTGGSSARLRSPCNILAERLLPKSRYSAAPASGIVRMMSSQRILYVLSSRFVMIYSTKNAANMDSMKFITAEYGDSHLISNTSHSA